MSEVFLHEKVYPYVILYREEPAIYMAPYSAEADRIVGDLYAPCFPEDGASLRDFHLIQRIARSAG